MTRIQLFFLFVIYLFAASPLMGQLTWTPERIRSGEEVTFTYKAKGTPLEQEKTIVFNLYQLDGSAMEVHEIPVQYEQGKITGSFKVNASTKALLFGIANEEVKVFDRQGEDPNYTLIYKADGNTPVEGAYASAAHIFAEFGQFVRANLDGKEALGMLEKELALYPEAAKDIKLMNFHLGLAVSNKDETAINKHESLINDLFQKDPLSVAELSYLRKHTFSVKADKEKAEEIKERMIKEYPKSNAAAFKMLGEVRKAKEVKELIEVLERWNLYFADNKSWESSTYYIVS